MKASPLGRRMPGMPKPRVLVPRNPCHRSAGHLLQLRDKRGTARSEQHERGPPSAIHKCGGVDRLDPAVSLTAII
eukprot:363363-Chlamydomonas_euryale.AAC.11